MTISIKIKELNQPSTVALKNFNQYVFEITQQYYRNNVGSCGKKEVGCDE